MATRLRDSGGAPRIHVGTWANPLDKDLPRFGAASLDEYLHRIAAALPSPFRLTCSRSVLRTTERPERGGRDDDDERVRDLAEALDDPRTRAVVALSGGGWMSRLLPRLDLSVLRRRRRPVWVLGFSELTGLVNTVASAPGRGRGLYWLCPNYLAWKVAPRRAAMESFDRFWRGLPALLDRLDGGPGDPLAEKPLVEPVLSATRVQGSVRPGTVRIVGGCLSVLAALSAAPWWRRRLRPDAWLLLEDLNEPAYRNDRHLAAITHAGWLKRVGGILLGDFHTAGQAQTGEVLHLLRFHLRAAGRERLPVLLTKQVGHVWPMTPLPIGAPLALSVRGREVTICPRGWR